MSLFYTTYVSLFSMYSPKAFISLHHPVYHLHNIVLVTKALLRRFSTIFLYWDEAVFRTLQKKKKENFQDNII